MNISHNVNYDTMVIVPFRFNDIQKVDDPNVFLELGTRSLASGHHTSLSGGCMGAAHSWKDNTSTGWNSLRGHEKNRLKQTVMATVVIRFLWALWLLALLISYLKAHRQSKHSSLETALAALLPLNTCNVTISDPLSYLRSKFQKYNTQVFSSVCSNWNVSSQLQVEASLLKRTYSGFHANSTNPI